MTASQEDDFARALTAQLPALRRYAIVLVGNTAADDLVQDCIERALRQWTKLEHLERIGGWLRSILHNLHIDGLRRSQRQGLTVELANAENDHAVIAPNRDTAAAVDFDRVLRRLSLEHK